jgi:ribosomal protein S18 acetylase RimI-like enzyme
MDFVTKPASNYPVAELVSMLNQGFEDYFIPIDFTNSMFLNMLHKDGIDLSASRLLLEDQTPCGIALIAPRGARRVSRLAAMGIAKEIRGKGAGSWLMKELVQEACERGEREMVLEVIEQNEPAVKLYQKCGFESVRRLVGYTYGGKNREEHEKGELHEIDLREMDRLISQYGLSDLPWQLTGESVTQMNPPPRAYRNGQAYIVISNPEAEHLVIWSLLVEPKARGNGLGIKILKQVVANWEGKTWHVPALCPEEFKNVFEKAGYERETLSQWQMKLNL